MNKHILVATHHLIKAGGTETYTFTIIEELLKRGYSVEYFCFKKGNFAKGMEERLHVSFMSRKKYDLIIANHYTCINYLFNRGFCIQTCHGIFPKKEQPSKFADRYVAISLEVKKHLQNKGVQSEIIFNSINTERFNIKNPINEKLKTVLSLCHSEDANLMIAQACELLKVRFIKQSKYDNPTWHVDDLINQSDLVIGVGRSAFEAMACGRPVIIFDSRHYFTSCGDGYVIDIIKESIEFNCSGRFKNEQFSAIQMKAELMKYNPSDGSKLRNFSLKELNIHINIERYLNMMASPFQKKATIAANLVNTLIGCWFRLFYYLKYPMNS